MYYNRNMSRIVFINAPPVFEETMMQVADRFDDPPGVESVVLGLPYRISEAMLTMVENIDSINNKVRAHIGTKIQFYIADQTIWNGLNTQDTNISTDIVSWTKMRVT